ncbi:MAG: hypothetical protein LH654_14750 [Thermoleophilia bacterium]|nr:hypothetical protein [Thermoleophilia bacterium]
MERLIVITTPELADGYRLAGATTVAVEDAAAAQAKLTLLLDEEEGLVAVHEPWLSAFDPMVRREFERRRRPLVVALPAGGTDSAGEERGARLRSLLEHAVGYEITFDREGQQ